MLERLAAALLVLCGVLAAAACGGAHENPSTSAPPEPYGPTLQLEDGPRTDAHGAVTRDGLSGEEVLRRHDLESNLIPAFEQRVGNQERYRYGGLYIEHEPDYRIVVLLTSGDVSDLDVPEHLRGLVVVRHVERTLAELGAVMERLSELRSVVPFSAHTDVTLNRVELGLIAPTRSELESATRAIGDAAARSGEPLPRWVTLVGHIVPVDGTPGEHPDFLLTYSSVGSGFGFDAIPSGVLELDLDRGCVLLSGQAVIWPAGTTLSRDPPRLHLPGGLTARPGATVRGGGGVVPPAGPRQSSSGIEGDLEKALGCATEPEVVVFWSRGGSMSVSAGG
jgi:hypothetical protein